MDLANLIPIPLEEDFRAIASNSQLLKSEKQFIPLLEALEITDHTSLPAFSVLTNNIEENTMEGYGLAQVVLTIWDVFPPIGKCTSLSQAHRVAVLLAHSYRRYLRQMLYILTDDEGLFASRGYDLPTKINYTTRYKRELFDQRSIYADSPLGERLIGSSALVTIKAPVECIQCPVDFTPEFVKTCLTDSLT